jgi:DNA-directed RNA polymerase beta' subunit
MEVANHMEYKVKMFAWLKINKDDEFKVIHPLMYRKIAVFLGTKSKTLQNIINFKMDMSLDGKFKKIDGVDYAKNPYYGIGMLEFYKRFDEIMLFYYKKKKNRSDLYEHIMKNKDKVFTNCIPVYSAVLRQVFFSDEDYKYTPLDKLYNSIFGNFQRINEETEVNDRNFAKLNKNLFRAQTNLNKAFDMIFTSLTEKEGLIRRNILGGRINFSSRTVITPNAKLRSYQIEIPYVCAVELYKEQIINLLVKMDGESFNEAVETWFSGFVDFNPKIYKVIQYLMKHTKGGLKCLLNRNPQLIIIGGLLE